MFNKTKPNGTPPSPQAATDTIIGAGTRIEGTLVTPENVLVEGEITGRVECSQTVVLNNGGRLVAEIDAKCVIVHGEVIGNINAHEKIEVGPTGRIKGDVEAGSARVTEGGMLDGKCVIVPENQRKEFGKTSEKEKTFSEEETTEA